MITSFVPPQTPALVVDRSVLDHNLAAMQSLCDAARMRLRPHGKMHKCSTLGRLQIERGAVGLCAQTVGEAEAFAEAGIPDVLVTSPAAEWAAPRIAAIARGARVGASAVHRAQIAWLGAAGRAADWGAGAVPSFQNPAVFGAMPSGPPRLIDVLVLNHRRQDREELGGLDRFGQVSVHAGGHVFSDVV